MRGAIQLKPTSYPSKNILIQSLFTEIQEALGDKREIIGLNCSIIRLTL